MAAVRAHHERLDGSGYPHQLRGRQIPFGAQILAVADTYAALTSPRPHRPALEPKDALAATRAEATAGRLSPKLVDLLHEIVNTPGRTAGGAAAAAGIEHGSADGLPPLAQSSDGLAISY